MTEFIDRPNPIDAKFPFRLIGCPKCLHIIHNLKIEEKHCRLPTCSTEWIIITIWLFRFLPSSCARIRYVSHVFLLLTMCEPVDFLIVSWPCLVSNGISNALRSHKSSTASINVHIVHVFRTNSKRPLHECDATYFPVSSFHTQSARLRFQFVLVNASVRESGKHISRTEKCFWGAAQY